MRYERDRGLGSPRGLDPAEVCDPDLGLVPLPLDLPPTAAYLSWHQRYDTDPAHIWLRDLARTALITAFFSAT